MPLPSGPRCRTSRWSVSVSSFKASSERLLPETANMPHMDGDCAARRADRPDNCRGAENGEGAHAASSSAWWKVSMSRGLLCLRGTWPHISVTSASLLCLVTDHVTQTSTQRPRWRYATLSSTYL